LPRSAVVGPGGCVHCPDRPQQRRAEQRGEPADCKWLASVFGRALYASGMFSADRASILPCERRGGLACTLASKGRSNNPRTWCCDRHQAAFSPDARSVLTTARPGTQPTHSSCFLRYGRSGAWRRSLDERHRSPRALCNHRPCLRKGGPATRGMEQRQGSTTKELIECQNARADPRPPPSFGKQGCRSMHDACGTDGMGGVGLIALPR
jgi:hypothetical protein